MVIYDIIATIRPQQWVKNAFILAPALFSMRIVDPTVWSRLVLGFIGFSFLASGVYALNDLCNREEDRYHPVKRHRPVASGRITPGRAALISAVFVLSGIALLATAAKDAALAGATYFGLMALYSLGLRRLIILDVIIIAVGFVLRVLAGGTLIDDPVSPWLVLCTFTLALFLGMIKRRQEIVGLTGGSETAPIDSPSSRAVLSKYPRLAILDGWINVLAGMSVLGYALYTVDPQTVAKHHTGALIYTVPFALFGVFRYQQLALEGTRGEDPTGLILKDAGMMVVIILWAVVVTLILLVAG